MATSNGQRVGISIILVTMVVGTIGSYVAMVLSQQNATIDAANQQKEIEDYQKAYQAYESRVSAQAAELSAKYYPVISQYASRVGEFNLEEANKESKNEDLLVGDGETIDGTTKFAAYYIGWLPSGKIFDQSIVGEALKSPLSIDTGLDAAGLIEGWKTGMIGMKIGGVRELTIVSDKAYGEAGSKDGEGNETIPPNTPLRFIVMAVALPEQIPQPELSESILQGLY